MKYEMANGYRVIYMPTHPMADGSGFVYEHRLIASQKLGRLLSEEETVHHIDGNRLNNNVDNLMIFKTKADHTAFHNGRKAILIGETYVCEDMGSQNICPICKTNIKDSKATMCLNCYKQLRISKRPSKEELQNKLISYNYSEIAREYNVSGNTVIKWAKAYDIYKPRQQFEIDEEELRTCMKANSISSAAKIFSVSNWIIKEHMKKYNIPLAVEKIQCIDNGLIYDSQQDAVREIVPNVKSARSEAVKLKKAIENDGLYYGFHWRKIKIYQDIA